MQVAVKTGADWVLYQDLEDLEAAVREVNPDIPRFDSSCFRLVLWWLWWWFDTYQQECYG